MGRIPISEKFKSIAKSIEKEEKKNSLSSANDLNREINAVVLYNNKNTNYFCDFNEEAIIFYPKEFRNWLNSQLDYSKKINFNFF